MIFEQVFTIGIEAKKKESVNMKLNIKSGEKGEVLH